MNAELPLERDQCWLIAYSAVFVKLNGELWIVRCLGILLDNGKNWYTHWSRVTLITTEDDVIPPPFRPAFARCVFSNRGGASQLAAHSASTGTASGMAPSSRSLRRLMARAAKSGSGRTDDWEDP